VTPPTTPIRLSAGRLAGACLLAAGLATAIYCAHVYFGFGGGWAAAAIADGGYNAAMLGAALAVILRALSRQQDRAALLAIGSGMLMWALGDLYYTVYYSNLATPPTPSIDDALYLSYYPLLFIGLALLIRRRRVNAALWLDGLTAALGLVAVAAGLLLDPIISSTGGSLPVVATDLAYPVGDLLLLVAVITSIGLMGWRPGLTWGLVALALCVQAIADTVYLFEVARGTYVENQWLETLWPLASMALLAGLWLAPRRAPARASLDDGWRTIAVPSVGAGCAVVLLFADHGRTSLNAPARLLALATLVVAAVRILLAFRDTRRRQRESEREAMTDALTNLGNRRMLTSDLAVALDSASDADPWLLFLYDLNGFKQYNDSFGHPAGDALLARLGASLAAAAAPHGRAYRMGGDEFCALMQPRGHSIDELAAVTADALCEAGEGFQISAAYGLSLLPLEAGDAETALQLADRRLYARKESRPVGVKHQLRGVLLEVLGARVPSLLDHLDGVAALALAVGRRMKLEPEELDELVRAAELHDVGKTAIPEAIINKPGPLDEREWAFMRQHTIFGERILSAAPALVPVARLVRSSHERWDGSGYPDELAGEEIPLGSRIIFACDAFDAIISARPYQGARSPEAALAELVRCSGSQFDPRVVAVLADVVGEQGAGARSELARAAELEAAAADPWIESTSIDWAQG
jgi:diguanylate cyclase (GGDEF)-like protein